MIEIVSLTKIQIFFLYRNRLNRLITVGVSFIYESHFCSSIPFIAAYVRMVFHKKWINIYTYFISWHFRGWIGLLFRSVGATRRRLNGEIKMLSGPCGWQCKTIKHLLTSKSVRKLWDLSLWKKIPPDFRTIFIIIVFSSTDFFYALFFAGGWNRKKMSFLVNLDKIYGF